MESLDEMTKTSSAKEGFFKHVFNMDDGSKEDILNIIQYSLLAIIPILLLNKLMQFYVPETDDTKGNIELSVEVLSQVLIIFLGILFIHRLITYIPTYSGSSYAKFNVTNVILAILLIVLSLQTKLGDKVNVLVDRLFDYLDGDKDKKQENVKKKKPKTNNNNNNNNNNNQQSQQQNGGGYNNNSNENSTSISQLPSVPPPQSLAQQSNPDFNAMFAQQTTPLVNASSPGGQSYENFGPMAANEALGGGFGGSNW